jgi:hypothetical protein
MATLRVSASCGLKKPSDPSNTFAGSVESHVSYALEDEYKGLSEAESLKKLSDLQKQLDNGVKLAVAAATDTGFVMDGDIVRLTPVTVPTIPHSAAPQSPGRAQQGTYGPPSGGRSQGGGSHRGGGGAQQYAPPKVDPATLPILMLKYFNDAPPVAFYDCRGAKANGQYAPNAADFRSVDKFTRQDGTKNQIPVWLADKDGNVNTWETSLVAHAEAADGDQGRAF